MSKICSNCGRELKDAAKYCGRCGTKVQEIYQNDNFQQQGYMQTPVQPVTPPVAEEAYVQAPAQPYAPPAPAHAQPAYTQQYQAPVQTVQYMQQPIQDVSSKSKKTISLPNVKLNKKLIAIISACAVVIIALVAGIALIAKGGGVSDKVVLEAATEIAEQAYGAKIELKNGEIIDSFTAKSENALTGKKVKCEMYLVIVEADVKDTSGEIVETVKYGVSVVDPEKKDGAVIYNQGYSQAQDYTGMENSEIKSELSSYAAQFR